MKKITVLFAVLLSTTLINARAKHDTRESDEGGGASALLVHATSLEAYANLSLTDLLDQGKAEEAWDIIGDLYNAMFSEGSSVDAKTAREVMEKINDYKESERAKLGTRSRQIKK